MKSKMDSVWWQSLHASIWFWDQSGGVLFCTFWMTLAPLWEKPLTTITITINWSCWFSSLFIKDVQIWHKNHLSFDMEFPTHLTDMKTLHALGDSSGIHPFHRFYSITQPRNSAGKFKGPRLGNCDTNFSAVLCCGFLRFPDEESDVGFKQKMLDKDKRKCLWILVFFVGPWKMDLFCIFSLFLWFSYCLLAASLRNHQKIKKIQKEFWLGKLEKKHSCWI